MTNKFTPDRSTSKRRQHDPRWTSRWTSTQSKATTGMACGAKIGARLRTSGGSAHCRDRTIVCLGWPISLCIGQCSFRIMPAQFFSVACRVSPNRAKSAETARGCRILANIGRNWGSGLRAICPNWVKFGPALTSQSRPTSGKVGQNRPSLGQTCPSLGRIRPRLGQPRPKPATFGQTRPKLCGLWQTWGRTRPNLGQPRPMLAKLGTESKEIIRISIHISASTSAACSSGGAHPDGHIGGLQRADGWEGGGGRSGSKYKVGSGQNWPHTARLWTRTGDTIARTVRAPCKHERCETKSGRVQMSCPCFRAALLLGLMKVLGVAHLIRCKQGRR